MIAAFVLLVATFETTHPHSDATLVSSVTRAIPGRPFLVGIQMSMDPTWHCYWSNPGDSGIPTSITWKLPKGWKAGDILWPAPERLEASGLVNYGYEHSVLLLTRITPPDNAPMGSEITLKAEVKWLICQSGCLAASESVSEPMRLGPTSMDDPAWKNRIDKAFAALPAQLPGFQFVASRDKSSIKLTMVQPAANENASKASFFAGDDAIEPAAPQEVIRTGSTISWNLKVSDFAPAHIARLKGLLIVPKGATWGHGTDALVVDIPVESSRGSRR